MTPKPKIQYVGQFYVCGSEAKALQQNPIEKSKAKISKSVQKRVENINIEPVAIASIVVAVCLLVTMLMGVVQLQKDWEQYQIAAQHLHEVKEENRIKTEQYRQSFDRAEVRAAAESMGMIPKAEAKRESVKVTVPLPEPEETILDQIKLFVKGLLA